VVFACGVIFAHRLYPIFVFACGAVMAGVATFVFRAVLDLMDSPTALISLMMMVSVFGGLLLQQSRMFSYRILTPILGGLLMAASIRFFSIDAFTKASVTWLSFTHFSLRPAYVVTDPLEVFFVVTWGVCTCLGWYSQLISVLAGVDPLQLPEHFSLQLQRLNKWFPWIFDGGEEFASDILPSLRQEREPFLPKEGENQSSARMPDFDDGLQRVDVELFDDEQTSSFPWTRGDDVSSVSSLHDCISYKLYLAQTCDVGIEGFIPIAAAFHAW